MTCLLVVSFEKRVSSDGLLVHGRKVYDSVRLLVDNEVDLS